MNKDRQLLLIDDDPTILVLVKHYLGPYPVKIHHAENGFDALHLLQENSIELIVLDVSMPIMNGHDFLKRLRNMSSYNDTPVIIMTSSDQKRDVMKFIKLEVNDYLLKPPPKELFVDRVKALLLL